MKGPSRRALRLLGAGVGAAAVVALFVIWAGPDRLLEAVLKIGWRGCLLMFGLYFVAQVLRTFRALIGLPAKLRPPLPRLFAIVSLHQWSNHVMPARLGEAAFPFLLARFAAIDSARGFSLLLRIRLQEISVLGALFLAALTLLFANAGQTAGNNLALLFAGIVLFVMPFFLERSLPRLLKALANRVGDGGSGFRGRVSAFLHRTETALAERDPHWVTSTAITGALWVCMFALFHVVMRLTGHPLAFHETVVGSSFANVSQLLPLNTIGSFGSLEAGWTLGFSLIGVPARDALAAGFIMHLLVLVFITLLAGAGWLLLKLKNTSYELST